MNQRELRLYNRERVLTYLSKGLTIEQISERLGIAKETIYQYRREGDQYLKEPKHAGGRARALTLHQALLAWNRYQKGEQVKYLAMEYECSQQTMHKYFKLIRQGKLS